MIHQLQESCINYPVVVPDYSGDGFPDWDAEMGGKASGGGGYPPLGLDC